MLTSAARMTIGEAYDLAARRIGKASPPSAAFCLQDAASLIEAGQLHFAWHRIAKSLAYSVGVGHSDYRTVADLASGS